MNNFLFTLLKNNNLCNFNW